MPQQDNISVEDTDTIKNILVQIDLKNDRAQVISNYTAWEHLALLTEAIGASIDECIEEGMDKTEVLSEAKKYFEELMVTYSK